MNRTQQQEDDEIVPVAVSLRNAFAPQQLMSQASVKEKVDNDNGHHHWNGDGNGVRTVKGEYDNDSDENDYQCKSTDTSTHAHSHSHSLAGSYRNRGKEATLPDTLIESQSKSYIHIPSMKFPARSRSEMQGHETYSITHIPVEMELVAPYTLLVQLKHSYKNCEEMKNRISAQFGLGKMEHENSGKNDGDVSRFLSVCSRRQDGRGVRGVMDITGNQASHPLWDHLNERLDDLYETIISLPNQYNDNGENENGSGSGSEDEKALRDQIWNDIRSHMRIQCKAILHSSEISNQSSPQSVILASVPLNPRRLIPLPVNEKNDADTNANANVNDNLEPNILVVSKYNNSIPHSLPRNSILVHFSDGSTRVCPTLYDVLLRRNVIEESKSNVGTGYGVGVNGSYNVEVDKFERRFEDDIFNMLGEVSSNNGSGHDGHYCKVKLKRNGSFKQNANGNGNDYGNGRLNGLKTIDASKGSFAVAFESLAIRSPSLKGMQVHNATQNSGVDELVSSMDMSNDDSDSAENSTTRSNNTTIDAELNGTHVGVGGGPNVLSRITRYNDKNSSQDEASGDSSPGGRDILTKIEDLDEDMERLQQVLGEEEAALKIEQGAQEMDVQWLRTFMVAVDDLEDERIEIRDETVVSEKKSKRLEEILVARRATLFKELRKNIFPIQTHDAFTIHGIHLPKDLHSLVAYDEIISAGLGFVCLLVMMCSKYLSIPLRHRLIFNSSRSAVRDCDLGIFPLFKERVVEKDQFDRAIVLLNRNIDHLLQSQGVQIRERSHMLEKLELLLDHLI